MLRFFAEMLILNKYSQNFLRSNDLVERLIQRFGGLSKEDIVLDLGAGRGILSAELSKYAKEVIAYEIDEKLSARLSERKIGNVKIINGDLLKAHIDDIGSNLRVFSNIPFFLTAEIVRKLFIESNNIETACLIMEYGAAKRFIGYPIGENSVLSVLINSRYESSVVWKFRPSDFFPTPSVQIVLVKFELKINGVKPIDSDLYRDFVAYAYNKRKNSLKASLLDLWRYEKLKQLFRNLHINLSVKTSELMIDQWLCLFEEFKNINESKKNLVNGEFERLNRHREKLNKNKSIIYNKT